MPSAIIHSTRVRGSRVALSVVRSGLGDLLKAGRGVRCRRFVEVMLEDEGAGEVVVGAIGEDEFYFVVFGEGGEVLHAEGVGGGSSSGAFDVDYFVDGFGDFCEWAFAAGFDHEGVAGA